MKNKLVLKSVIFGAAVGLAAFSVPSVVQAKLTVIGTATYNGSEYKLIWDDYNLGNSVIWLDYTYSGDYGTYANWTNTKSWAAGLDSSLTYNIDAAYIVDWDDAAWRLGKVDDDPHRGESGSTELGQLLYELVPVSEPVTNATINAREFDNLLASYYWCNSKVSWSTVSQAWYYKMTSRQLDRAETYAVLHGLALRSGQVTFADSDNDGIINLDDNCPTVFNPGQEDESDNDGLGEVCDPDDDNDGVLDVSDNCQITPNNDQSDCDEDGVGDACVDDDDNDGVADVDDNCVCGFNPDNLDNDGDGYGDVCDTDDDNDEVPDYYDDETPWDNCQFIPNASQADCHEDDDGLGDVCDPDDDDDGILDDDDKCVCGFDPTNLDTDGDGYGDVCDGDIDGDGVDNGDDNCPVDYNPVNEDGKQTDTDDDLLGDACDPDDDNDGVLDYHDDGTSWDNCRIVSNPHQEDESDNDGLGEVCDPDDDNDGILDEVDNCPMVPNTSQNNWDGDLLGDECDCDIDGDGVLNDIPDVCDPPVLDDVCEFTELNEIIDPATGCSIDQLCPCDSPYGTDTGWKNNQYHVCIVQTCDSFIEMGLITEDDKNAIISTADNSTCGAQN